MKFFIYARKSTDDEERQILSIQAQPVSSCGLLLHNKDRGSILL